MIVNFPLDEDPNVSMIAWTTTPWTLPSNLALVVNPDMDYVKVKGIFTHIMLSLPIIFTFDGLTVKMCNADKPTMKDVQLEEKPRLEKYLLL